MKNVKLPIPKPYQYFNTPYETKQISTSVLHSGQGYQRKVKMNMVKKIVAEFDPKLLEEIVVSFRDGKFYVVDGQHRIVALKQKNEGFDCIVNCKVITGLTYEQEADLYERFDANKKRLSISDTTRAKAEAGNDEDITNIKKILAANKIDWVFSSSGGSGAGGNKISATRSVLNAYELLGFSGFAYMIRLIERTWHGDKNSLNMYIISGMALFVSTYLTELNEEHFIQKLSIISPKDIVSIGKTDAGTREMGLKYARVIWNKYNYRQRIGLLEYRFNG